MEACEYPQYRKRHLSIRPNLKSYLCLSQVLCNEGPVVVQYEADPSRRAPMAILKHKQQSVAANSSLVVHGPVNAWSMSRQIAMEAFISSRLPFRDRFFQPTSAHTILWAAGVSSDEHHLLVCAGNATSSAIRIADVASEGSSGQASNTQNATCTRTSWAVE